jgi:hypothetical protein
MALTDQQERVYSEVKKEFLNQIEIYTEISKCNAGLLGNSAVKRKVDKLIISLLTKVENIDVLLNDKK